MTKEALKLALEALEKLTNAAEGFSVSGVYFNEELWARKCLDDAYDAMGFVQEALAQPEQEFVAKKMTAHRAAYFMERFKHEEKLLGPNEQAALDFVISMLEAQPEQEQEYQFGVYGAEDLNKAWKSGYDNCKAQSSWTLEDVKKAWKRGYARAKKEQRQNRVGIYTTPPQRKPLTDEETIILKGKTCPEIDWKARHGVEMNNGERNQWMLDWFMAFKVAIEAAHGIKE